MKPTVVHLKRKGGQIVQDCDVYIGRAQNQGGWNLKKSEWGNRFSAKTYTREESIRLYKNELYEKILCDLDSWIPKLEELRGKRLGCWCVGIPAPCHGQVIADLVEEVCKIVDEKDETLLGGMMERFLTKLENPK